MSNLTKLLAVAAVVCTSAAQAQFVKGNEAVRLLPDGKKTVETPPLPKTGSAKDLKPCQADGNCYPGPWHMVETPNGLLECTEVYARTGSCRTSTYGTTKIRRLWVIKSGSVWLQCQYPDLKSKCVPIFARPPANLPYDASQ
jgi:hypothetical protein